MIMPWPRWGAMSIELFTCNADNYHNNRGNDDNDSSEKGGNMGCGIGDVANQPRGDGSYEIDYSDDLPSKSGTHLFSQALVTGRYYFGYTSAPRAAVCLTS